MRELFVYYPVGAARADLAKAEVQRFQASLRDRYPCLQARLLRRPGEAGCVQTWMEVYACPGKPGGLSQDLHDDIERAAEPLASLIAGPRHTEVFEPL